MNTAVSLAFRPVVAVVAGLVLLVPPLVRAQGNTVRHIQGRMVDGTTNQPVVGHELRLLMPRGGMQQVGTASTNSEGHFSFEQAQIDPSAFYLVSTEFQGAAYNAPARFESSGTASVNLTVYDSTKSDADLQLANLLLLARAEGSRIRVRQQYAIQNSSRPPRAYVNAGGTFHFRLSPEVKEPSVVVTGLMNMPIPQTPEPGKSPGEFFIRYPLKPETTVITVEYETDYSSSGFVLGGQTSYPVGHVEAYVSPSTLAVDSTLLKPAGVDSQNDVRRFEAENLPRGAAIEARLSGEPAPGSPGGPAPGDQQAVKEAPNSITALALPLMGCFLLVLLWALGVRVAREWPTLTEQKPSSPVQKKLEAKLDTLLNSLADLDDLFAAGKIVERNYWKERLELKARVVAILKKSPPALIESYATRHLPR